MKNIEKHFYPFKKIIATGDELNNKERVKGLNNDKIEETASKILQYTLKK